MMRNTIYIIIFMIFSFSSLSQSYSVDEIENIKIKVSGEICIDTILNQYSDSPRTNNFNPYIGNFSLCYDSLYYFKFEKFDKENRDKVDLIIIQSDTVKFSRNVLRYEYYQQLDPLLKSNIDKLNQFIELNEWKINVEYKGFWCSDTQYYTLEISNTKGAVIFENINNFNIYKVKQTNSNEISFFITSMRYCSNEMMIFRII